MAITYITHLKGNVNILLNSAMEQSKVIFSDLIKMGLLKMSMFSKEI